MAHPQVETPNVALPARERLTWQAICARYPDEWVVMIDVEYENGDEELELTEAVPLSKLDVSANVLREICDRGVHVVVDDLGSGYSNLRYLADLKPKVVKIDRELVAGLVPNSRRFTLMRNLVRMCSEFSALVVEGIETAAELSAVIDAGVNFGQGYVLARPEFPPPKFTWPL